MIHFACLILGSVVTMYNLVVGFLVPSEGGSSSRDIGSSIGERKYVW